MATTSTARKPFRSVQADGTAWITWVRTSPNRRRHALAWDRHLACGAPYESGEQFLKVSPVGTIPPKACARCAAIAKEN